MSWLAPIAVGWLMMAAISAVAGTTDALWFALGFIAASTIACWEAGRDTDGSGEAGQTAKQAGPGGREPGPEQSEGIAQTEPAQPKSGRG
jgi:hypothetical protein